MFSVSARASKKGGKSRPFGAIFEISAIIAPCGRVAQLVEQLTLNQWVQSSILCASTTFYFYPHKSKSQNLAALSLADNAYRFVFSRTICTSAIAFSRGRSGSMP